MSEQPPTNIDVSLQGRVLQVVMNRPERKNALSMAMYTAMADAINGASESSEVRAILIRGAEGSFTSGNDLEDFMQNPSTEGDSPVLNFMKALYNCPKPVVAAVQGAAVGIGTTMLLHCDLVIAGDSAKFQMPFANLGICPEYASSLFLPQIMGHVKAAELLLLGEPFGPQQAESCGIVNQVVPDEELLAVAEAKVERLVQQPPAAIRATKRLLRAGQHQLGIQVMEQEMELFEEGLKSAEFTEAVTAFFEKRKPDFSKFE